jgi:hypothetical protein
LVAKEAAVTLPELKDLLSRLYPSSPWPKPFPILHHIGRADAPAPLAAIAKESGVTKKHAESILTAADPMSALFGGASPSEKAVKSARQMLGNLIVGHCAERIFVDHYKKEAATNELVLSDVREGRSDTDYRLLNGRGRPVYRINIKFVGSQFRRAQELVSLEPSDCFALATYKINAALQKQVADKLPFLFIIVSVPGLSADEVGGKAPEDLREFLGLVTQAHGISKKRNIQDHIVKSLEENQDPGFYEVLERIEHGSWHVLSARRADKLLREKLFERVYALRIRGFAQQFRGAELDMHFSLSTDLTPLDTYLHTLRESGYPMVTTLLERGEY